MEDGGGSLQVIMHCHQLCLPSAWPGLADARTSERGWLMDTAAVCMLDCMPGGCLVFSVGLAIPRAQARLAICLLSGQSC